MPLADASFDVATCSYLLHLLSRQDRADVVAELARVLVGGGRLGVVTVAPPAGSLARLVSFPVRRLAQRSSGALAGLRPLDPSGELRAAGFEVELVRRVRGGYPSLCVAATRRESTPAQPGHRERDGSVDESG